jgi:hypothetical protein
MQKKGRTWEETEEKIALRRQVCQLGELQLILTSTVILGSESRHISLSHDSRSHPD